MKNDWYYCVYKHIAGGEVIYVGCGDKHRAFNFNGRSDAWIKATENKKVEVEILARFNINDKQRALELESMLIDSFLPKANLFIPKVPKKITSRKKISTSDQFRQGLSSAITLTGISSRQASMKAGFNEGQINRFMHGLTDIKLSTLDDICRKGFGMSFDTVYRMGA